MQLSYLKSGILGPEFPEFNGDVYGTVVSLFFLSDAGEEGVEGAGGVGGVEGVDGAEGEYGLPGMTIGPQP